MMNEREPASATRREAMIASGIAIGGVGQCAWTPDAASATISNQASVFVLSSTKSLARVPGETFIVRTYGFAEPADGGGALYRRVGAVPKHKGWFRSVDGVLWELTDDMPSIKAFGAVGNGQEDDRAAIQAAIDFVAMRGGGTAVVPPGQFRLVMTPAPDGTGPIGLWMRSGVRLKGLDRLRSVLVLADAQRGPGTFGRVIASPDLTDATLADFTLDANRTGQGAERDATNGAAIMLGTAGAHVERVQIENLVVRNANGQGIQVVGHPKAVSHDIVIRGNRVERSSFIGIQVSHFVGLVIDDNDVIDCHDNGIDIYGDDFVTRSNIVTGRQASIARNRVRQCASGVFLETVADIDVLNNLVDGCRVTGVHVNRIHGEPSGITIAHNRVTATPIGASITGDTGGISFQGNYFSRFTEAALQFGLNGQGNVSFVVATDNIFDARGTTCPIVLGSVPTGTLSWVQVRNNYVYGTPAPDHLFVNYYGVNNLVKVGEFVGLQRDYPD